MRDQHRRRNARVQRPCPQRRDGARHRGEEVDRHRHCPPDLRNHGDRVGDPQDASLRHEDVGREDGAEDEGEAAGDVERQHQHAQVGRERIANRGVGGGIDGVAGSGDRRRQGHDDGGDRGDGERGAHDGRDQATIRASGDSRHECGQQAASRPPPRCPRWGSPLPPAAAPRRRRARSGRCPPAGMPRSSRSGCGSAGRWCRARGRQRRRRHRRGTTLDTGPRSSRRQPPGYRPRAASIEKEADRPHQLVRLASPQPLVADHRGKDEREDRRQEWQDHVWVHCGLVLICAM